MKSGVFALLEMSLKELSCGFVVVKKYARPIVFVIFFHSFSEQSISSSIISLLRILVLQFDLLIQSIFKYV
jgi:hypothetical protein